MEQAQTNGQASDPFESSLPQPDQLEGLDNIIDQADLRPSRNQTLDHGEMPAADKLQLKNLVADSGGAATGDDLFDNLTKTHPGSLAAQLKSHMTNY